MKKVLLVDDEPSIVTLLAFNLEKDGYEVTTATDGAEGYRLAISNPFDFIILDLMLPSMDGMDICKRLRQEKFDTPIMILTAKDDELEKIIGLELGADDYMTKPFSPREVLARMKAILRRTNKAVPAEPVATAQPEPTEDETEKIEVGEITIFPQLYEVHVAGELIEVTPKEFELLLYMAKRANRILSREQLLNAIWNFDYAGETRIVDVHISHLREKIEKDTKNPQYIRTVRGFGYKFEVAKT
ncbi:MAG: response regulator transcription factor [Trichococcus flocculiformis]|jgi:two-component system alkaline phosphatase synthesis response regulator PhoP|uniref:Response regulator transcription factor n=1 Tax=Trichococcus flocculiformis TaxID=82803 RepID=A0A847D3T9_9LACT|nr:response regulator transcription factor [Trichococcus flocculiformis]MBP6164899.1 response regulator transcription factor [Trichococcus sp.]MBP6246421.1 response regulator transcription factor [Trichococcus sp.]MBP7128625.1 response regulator transcription factor [Trichococcus sp.]MBP8683023.1 response regulator transcription factor [Trichococcus sp.]MBP9593895.1 response regulator transcription factor [Trichococcus sp.]